MPSPIANITTISFNRSSWTDVVGQTVSVNFGPGGDTSVGYSYQKFVSNGDTPPITIDFGFINSNNVCSIQDESVDSINRETFAIIHSSSEFRFNSPWSMTNVVADGTNQILSFDLHYDLKPPPPTPLQKHCPAFGATASFSALPNQVTFGDNHTQRNLKGINALKMSLSLQFNELKDDEAKELINYLKNISKYSIQNYDSAGKFDNKRIEAFDYQPFYPYKKNKFYCLNFSHEKPHYNINNINATLECAVPSILSSVESFAGHNSNIDCLINANVGSASTAQHNAALLSSGDLIYQSGNYVNAKLTDAFTAIPDSGPDDLLITSEFNFVDQNISSNQTSKRHSIFINDPNECFYYPYNPIYKHGTLDVRMFDFRASQSITVNNSPKTRQSNINDFYKKNNKYGFNEDLLNLNLQFNSRSDIEAKRILLFLESHLGYKKFGFHLSKDYFADADDGSDIINSRKSPLGFFYCPTWSHNYIYKDNHNISVNFIECLDY